MKNMPKKHSKRATTLRKTFRKELTAILDDKDFKLNKDKLILMPDSLYSEQ